MAAAVAQLPPELRGGLELDVVAAARAAIEKVLDQVELAPRRRRAEEPSIHRRALRVPRHPVKPR
jgi:hypothetical protein